MIKKILTLTSLLLILTMGSLCLTTPGLKMALYLTQYFTAYDISYKTAHGTLASTVSLTDVKIKDKNTIISINQLSLDWSLSHYLLHKINIGKLIVKKVNIDIQKSNDSTAFSFPTINHSIAINKIQIQSLSVTQNNKTVFSSNTISGHVLLNSKTINSQLNAQLVQPTALSTSLKIAGSPTQFKFTSTVSSKQHTWTINGIKNNNIIQLETVKNKLLSGTLTTHGSINISPLSWTLHITGKHLNLSRLNRQLPTSISFDATTKGSLSKQHAVFSQSILRAFHKHNTMTVQLSTGQSTKLNWNIDCKRLQSILPSYAGDIVSRGTISKTPHALSSTGSLRAKSLRLPNITLNGAHATWKILKNQNSNSNSSVHIVVNRSNIHHTQLRNTALTLTGSYKKHLILFNSLINNITSSATVVGHYTNNTWKASIKHLSLKKNNQLYQNKIHSNLSISDQNSFLGNTCLYNGPSSICFNLQTNNNKQWKGHIQTLKLPYQFFAELLSQPQYGNANVTATVSSEGTQGHLKSLLANINISAISLHKIESNITNTIQDIHSHIQYINNTLSTRSTLNINSQNNAALDISINMLNKKINGQLSAKLHNLKFLNTLIPNMQITRGMLQSNLHVSGILAHPNIRGNINISNGTIKVPRAGITLENFTSHMTGTGNTISSTSSATIHSQPIKIISHTQLNSPLLKTTINITGKNALLFQSPEYSVYGTPDIHIKANTKKANLWGKITIPHANIMPIQSTNIITLPTADIQYKHTATKASLPYPISISLDIALGQSIFIQTSGIKGFVTGNIYLRRSDNKPLFANGNISLIKGTFQAYGNTLNISPHSALIFSNSLLTHPNLSITATKKIQTASSVNSQGLTNRSTIVGIKVSGSIHHPKLTLFSIPATLNSNQILSLLVLGYTRQDQSNSSSTNQSLLNALSALKLTQTGLSSANSQGIMNKIQNTLGISELDINTQTSIDALGNKINSTPQTSLVVSKFLTKKIYLKYIKDLSSMSPVDIFQAIFFINDNWSIRASTSISASNSGTPASLSNNNFYNGVDLIYTMKKN